MSSLIDPHESLPIGADLPRLLDRNAKSLCDVPDSVIVKLPYELGFTAVRVHTVSIPSGKLSAAEPSQVQEQVASIDGKTTVPVGP
jgi:hypothetical protein